MRWEPAYLAALGPRGARLQQAIEVAEVEGDARQVLQALLDAGDALVASAMWREATLAFEHASSHADAMAGADRRLGAHLAWRLGQLAEGGRDYVKAAAAYEKAAHLFRLTGGGTDLVAAMQAEGRVRARTEGNQASMRLYREALALARELEDPGGVAEAMEMVAIAAHDMNAIEEAEASFREAARFYDAVGDGIGYVRATIGLAECELEGGDHAAAIQTLGPVQSALEVGHDDETRARAVGLLARFYLQAGESDEAGAYFQKALELHELAGSDRRRARLLQAFARALEEVGGPEAKATAIQLHASALDLYTRMRDAARIAPAAFSLARCYFEEGDAIRADAAIERALDVCQRRGDLEGLEIATELGVRIAVRLGQGKLGLARIEMAARVKGESGDYEGEVRYLLGALETALHVPGLDATSMADALIEALRRTGTRFLGPAEPAEIAERMEKADRPSHGSEILALLAGSEVEARRYAEAADAFAEAAGYAVRADDPERAGELWDQAIAIGERHGLTRTADWRIDRTQFGGQ